MRATSGRPRLVKTLFFLTGAAGLMYQVAWQRKLIDIFGVSIYSVTVIVSAYMAGLGLGSYFGGRISRRLGKPVVVYGLLELGVAFYGAISIPVLTWLQTGPFAELTRSCSENAVLALYAAASFGFFIVPTALMGLTLPILAQGTTNSLDASQEQVGELYGLNTLGAATGAWIAGYLLLELAGITRTTLLAAGCNAFVAATAVYAFGRAPATRPTAASRARRSSGLWRLSACYFLVGLLALGYEVFIFRYLTVLLSDMPYTFTILLVLYLALLGLGSCFSTRILEVAKLGRERVLARVVTLVSLVPIILCALFLLTRAARYDVFNLNVLIGAFRGYAFAYLRPSLKIYSAAATFLSPAVILGALFPMFAALAAQDADSVGDAVGRIYLANTAGGILGAALFGLWVLPRLGSEVALAALAAIPLLLLLLIEARARIRLSAALTAAGGLTLLLVFFATGGKLFPRTVLRGGDAEIIDSMEGRLGVTSALAHNGGVWLQTNSMPTATSFRKGEGVLGLGFSKDSLMHHALLQSLTGGRKAFFLGFDVGSGVAVKALSAETESVTVVELNSEIYALVRKHNPALMDFLNRSGKVRLLVSDAKRYLFLHDDKYDYINITPSSHVNAGAGYLYSRDFFELVHDRLNPGGRMAVTIYNGDLSAVRALLSVFRNVVLLDMTAICSDAPIDISARGIDRALASYGAAARGLRRADFLAAKAQTPLRNLRQIEPLIPNDILPSTIDRPRSEFSFVRQRQLYWRYLQGRRDTDLWLSGILKRNPEAGLIRW